MDDLKEALRAYITTYLQGHPSPPPPPPETSSVSVGALVGAGTTAAGTGLALRASKGLDRRLTAAGLATDMPGVHTKDVFRFLRSVPGGAQASLDNYARASSNFLNREISAGVRGLDLLKVLGNATYRAGADLRRAHPRLSLLADALRHKGAHFRADYKHPHFNGFGTSGAGIRTLLGEKANWGGLSLENMGYLAREALQRNGWQATPKAVRQFDRGFRDLIRQGYWYRPLPNSRADIRPLLEEIARTHRPGTDAQTIAQALHPGADIRKSLYDAVKGSLTGAPNARAEINAVAQTPAGRLALMAASGTSRMGSLQHGTELAALRALKALRGKGFRRGAGVAGALGTAALLYKAFKGGQNP